MSNQAPVTSDILLAVEDAEGLTLLTDLEGLTPASAGALDFTEGQNDPEAGLLDPIR